jgi:hypothetical protein
VSDWRVLEHPFAEVRQAFSEDYSVATMRMLIVLYCLVIVFLALFVVKNKWVLAGMLAYILLP